MCFYWWDQLKIQIEWGKHEDVGDTAALCSILLKCFPRCPKPHNLNPIFCPSVSSVHHFISLFFPFSLSLLMPHSCSPVPWHSVPFPNNGSDSFGMNMVQECRSGTNLGKKNAELQPWRVRNKQSRQPSSVFWSRSSRLRLAAVPGARLPSPTLYSTLIPILSARTPTFSSTGTQSTRQSSCLMPKQMTNHVRMWPFYY